MMVSNCEMEVEGDDKKAPEAKADLDLMAQQIQHLFTFGNSYDQMSFAAD